MALVVALTAAGVSLVKLYGMKLPTSYKAQLGPAAEFLLDKEWLEAAYAGRGARAVAAEIGCGKKAVLTALRRHGIAVGASGVNRTDVSHATFARSVPAVAIGKLDNPEWMLEYYISNNWTAKRIGALLGVSPECVQKWAKRHGLTKSRAARIEAVAYGYKESTGVDIRSDAACRKRINGHRRSIYQSVKAGAIVCHSSWEAAVAAFFDHHPSVKSYRKDALRIAYVWGGKDRWYYPDFLVSTTTRTLLLEVKASRLLPDDRTKAKLKAMREEAVRMGWDCLVVSGKTKVNLANLIDYFR